jgi:ribonuclease BN (tRNA processing enzyme)
LRVGDALALITDTAFDPESATFATGVRRLLHEAWSTSAKPRSTEGDATAAEAARVAAAARPESLTLIHLHPLADERALSLDARSRFAATEIGTDGAELAL